jgi:EpsI family protein
MRISARNLVVMAMMLLSAGLGAALRPTIFTADERPPIDLKAMVPTSFGDWQEQLNVTAQIIDPTQKETLDRIYSQILTRTFVNSQGYRVMLSLAYGKNQSKSLELHLPDVCYPAQGFSVADTKKSTLDILGKSVPITRLETNLGQRFEPVTYWTLVGDTITKSALEKRLVEIRYAVTGRIPDGILVRVSSIDRNPENAFAIQRRFASELIQYISPEDRNRFVGTLNGH